MEEINDKKQKSIVFDYENENHSRSSMNSLNGVTLENAPAESMSRRSCHISHTESSWPNNFWSTNCTKGYRANEKHWQPSDTNLTWASNRFTGFKQDTSSILWQRQRAGLELFILEVQKIKLILFPWKKQPAISLKRSNTWILLWGSK